MYYKFSYNSKGSYWQMWVFFKKIPDILNLRINNVMKLYIEKKVAPLPFLKRFQNKLISNTEKLICGLNLINNNLLKIVRKIQRAV